MAPMTARKDGTIPPRRSTHVRRIGIVLAAVAVLALTLGTSVTAATLITGKQIKDGSVTGKDLRNGSVTGADIRDGSLTPADYRGAIVGPEGPAGAAGPSGPVGPQGPSGRPGVRGIDYATSERDDLPAGLWTIRNAKCPSGTTAVSGGFAAESGASGGRFLVSAPLSNGTGWFVGIQNESSAAIVGGYTWVSCARTQ